jgi:2,4-dichlorophenol 6-monooxygenase
MPKVMGALGLFDADTPEEMWDNIDARKDDTPEARKQRSALREALDASDPVYNAHGVEMNQRYDSAAVVPDGTEDPGFDRDPVLYHQASSRPGAHLPHAWLIDDEGHKVSTLDLCGDGRFALLTGIAGGESWIKAAHAAEKTLGIDIDVHVIGPGQAHEDPYGNFRERSEISEEGVLLVRPDTFVGWRSHDLPENPTADLTTAVARILDREDELESETPTPSNAGEAAPAWNGRAPVLAGFEHEE